MMEIGGFINPGGGRGSTAAFSTPSRVLRWVVLLKRPTLDQAQTQTNQPTLPSPRLPTKMLFIEVERELRDNLLFDSGNIPIILESHHLASCCGNDVN